MVAPTSFFLDYGCHVRILEETRALQRLGQQVTIVTYYLGRDLPDLDIVRTRPTPWRSNYEVGSSLHKIAFDSFLAWTGVKTVLRRDVDLIHGHLHEGALIGHLLSRLRRLPLVADFQGSMTGEMVDHHFLDPQGPWYRWARLLEWRIAQLPDAIVTSTQMTALLLEQDFNCDDACVYPLPDCVSLDFFRPDVLDQAVVTRRRAALGIPRHRPVVVYLGLLADYQGTPHLLRAARCLKERGTLCHFLVMGFPSVDYYRKMAQDLGVADCVTFTGKVPYEEAPAHLALGDIAVAPKLSTTEGAGKILNYMAMELPTVAFDTPISREYLGTLGVYAAPVGDPAALARAIGGLLEVPARWRQLGRKLRQRVARHFSWDRSGRHLLKIYRSVLADPGDRTPRPRRGRRSSG
jgi:glycosyltransferase involved in cell wall biosynthesis